MHKVLIAGAGQLGSRYLQGLVKVDIPLEIYVFDLSESSLDAAAARWKEAEGPGKQLHRLFFISENSAIPASIDLAIVATGANCRVDVVQNISAVSKVDYWILEKVLAQSIAQIDLIAEAISGAKAAWVNTPRRVMKWYGEIKKHFLSKEPIAFSVTGGQWGLACNAIHFLDLMQWLTDEQLLEIDTNSLNPEWIPSKRPGYFEVMGTLAAQFSNGSTAILKVEDNNDPVMIGTKEGGFTWIIKEQAGVAERSDGLIVQGALEFQSALTSGIVKSILSEGECALPSFAASAALHKPFLRDMLINWNRSANKEAFLLPIT
jgi:hypothetical protein